MPGDLRAEVSAIEQAHAMDLRLAAIESAHLAERFDRPDQCPRGAVFCGLGKDRPILAGTPEFSVEGRSAELDYVEDEHAAAGKRGGGFVEEALGGVVIRLVGERLADSKNGVRRREVEIVKRRLDELRAGDGGARGRDQAG